MLHLCMSITEFLIRPLTLDDLLTAESSLEEEEWSDDDEEMASGLDHFESLVRMYYNHYIVGFISFQRNYENKSVNIML